MSLFDFLTNFMIKLKFNDFFKTKIKNDLLIVQIVFKNFPLGGKVGLLSEGKRVLCWSIS